MHIQFHFSFPFTDTLLRFHQSESSSDALKGISLTAASNISAEKWHGTPLP